MDKVLFKNGNHNVGLCDVSSITILGPLSDIKTFFECFNHYIDKSKLPYSPKLISDRLYKRSIKFEDLDKAEKLMKEIEKQFSERKTSDIDWEKFSLENKNSNLNLNIPSLDKVFDRYFKIFTRVISRTKFFLTDEDYKNSNSSIRLICTDLPFSSIESKITDEQFDAIGEDEEPIWMRVKYIGRDLDDHIKRIEKRNLLGETPMYLAATYGQTDIVKLLINYGVRI